LYVADLFTVSPCHSHVVFVTSCMPLSSSFCGSLVFFFSNDPATSEIYTLSLHDALPISGGYSPSIHPKFVLGDVRIRTSPNTNLDRKSTRLNSSHQIISYAVFCLKKKS